MNFREATIRLKDGPLDRDLADALDVTVQSVRQARLPSDNPGHRPPPDDWREVVAALARQRAEELSSVAARLEEEEMSAGR